MIGTRVAALSFSTPHGSLLRWVAVGGKRAPQKPHKSGF